MSDEPDVAGGFQASPKMGLFGPPGRSILIFSSPALLRIEIVPFASPSAMYCPSFVQAHALMRATDLYFWTAFCSDDQKEKSDTAHEASWCEIGLNAKH